MSENRNPADLAADIVRRNPAKYGIESGEHWKNFEAYIAQMRDHFNELVECEKGDARPLSEILAMPDQPTWQEGDPLPVVYGRTPIGASEPVATMVVFGEGEMFMPEPEPQWTTEFPTKPGFYWVRNLTGKPNLANDGEPNPDSFVVEITNDYSLKHPLAILFTGSEVPTYPDEIVSAEWYGPIEPPE